MDKEVGGGIGDRMNDKQKTGTESELLAEFYLVRKGYIVSKPINDFNEYDFVIDDTQGHLYTVQVKTVYFDNSKRRIQNEIY